LTLSKSPRIITKKYLFEKIVEQDQISIALFVSMVIFFQKKTGSNEERSEEMILTEPLMKAFKLYPQKQAIVCGGKRWTYREFYDRVSRLSHALKDLGIGKDDKVAILHPNCHYFLEAYYGIAQIGAVSVPINYRLSSKEIGFILRDSDSKVLIADPIFEKQIDPIRGEMGEIKKILWT
jgi:fatty-acyl-CoA synthase